MAQNLLEVIMPALDKKPVMLVVDDQPLNIRLIRDLFHQEFDIYMATDGLNAISKAQELSPDLILLDVVMPNMDGFEVCRSLKSDPETRSIPIIFITANFDEKDEIKGFELGGADFIRKPINPVITRARVRTQLALKQQADQLRSVALTDGLTGLANRRSFDRALENIWRQSVRSQLPLSLIMLDVDYFKPYNDHYGHQAGDLCLQKIASSMAQALNRPQDLLARYGGEEFACILPATDAAGASHIAKQLHLRVQLLQLPHARSEVSDFVTVSMGVVTLVPNKEESVETLIHTADKQLYRAKEQGRARTCAIDLGDI